MDIQTPRGTKDILPQEIGAWQSLETTLRRQSQLFGFAEIRTPIFEHTELFSRGIGEQTDVVGKEMYSFVDKGQTALTLRPEMTAGITRSVIEHTMLEQQGTVRVWSMGAAFRQDRPQKGRYRQFHQFDAEIFGSAYPESDAEIIAFAYSIVQAIGLTAFEVQINSLGNTASRIAYREALVAHLAQYVDVLSHDSKTRFEKNPLRVLDSKDRSDAEAIRTAPLLTDYLDTESADYFARVQAILTVLQIPFSVNPRLVRGLDYYSHTAFELVTTRLGTQNAIGGGGRYDSLFAQLTGAERPAVGFAFGMERLLLLLEEEGKVLQSTQATDLYIITLDDESRLLGTTLAHSARMAGIATMSDMQRRSFKAQMRDANKCNARCTMIIGENERLNRTVILKDMASGEQSTVALEQCVEELTHRLRTA
jgi:histidyl-tRNA synthetase